MSHNVQAFPTPLRSTGDGRILELLAVLDEGRADSVSEGSVGGLSLSFRNTTPCGNARVM